MTIFNQQNHFLRSKIMFLLLFFISLSNTLGQNKVLVDSLLKVMNVQKKDSLKVENLNELSWQYRRSDSQKAIEFALEALEISDSIDFFRGKVDALNRLGMIAKYQKEYDIAESLFFEELELEKEKKYEYGIARALNQLSNIYARKEKYEDALVCGIDAIEMFEKIEDFKSVALTANNIGNIFLDINDYENAGDYYLKSLKIRQQLNDNEKIGASLSSLGLLYLRMENYSKSLEYFLLAEESFLRTQKKYDLATVYNNLGNVYKNLKEKNKAFGYFTKSLSIKRELNRAHLDPEIHNNIGLLFYEEESYDEAIPYFLESLKISNETKNTKGIQDTSLNLGNIYFEKQEYTSAIDFYETVLKSAEKNNNTRILGKVYKNLTAIYSVKKNAKKALVYSQKYIQLTDSIDRDYQEAYLKLSDFEEERKQNALLKKDNKIVAAENKQQKILIYSLVAGLILSTLLFFAFIRGNKQKQKAILAEKNREIEKQKVQEKLKQQELTFINTMLEQQEKEKQRVAEDLHDRIGSLLSLVKIHINSLKSSTKKISKDLENKYIKVNTIVDETCDEVRKIAYNIASSVLSKYGLIAALSDLKEAIEEDQKIEVEFVSHGFKDRLHDELEVIIYRIIQELLNNTIKHSEATEITIQLIQGKEDINLTLEDNGIGFDANTIKTEGMGLKNVASRVHKINGELFIDSSIRNGTTITIDIPLNS